MSITITIVGGGTGVVRNTFGNTLCTSGTCVVSYPKLATSNVTLVGQPTNGSSSYFAGFSGDCTGLLNCTLKLDRDYQVTAEFRVQTYNFVFLSSTTPANTQADVTQFDAECNRLATNAGINTLAGDGYVAWVSGTGSSALARLGTTARGFVRLDEKPVADTIAGLLAGRIYYPIRVNDKLQTANNLSVRTATLGDGSASKDNCWDWGSESSGYYLTVGHNSGGPGAWTEYATINCLNSPFFYCFGKTISKELVVEKTAGKLIYLSEPYTPGNGTPDEACAASAPPNTGPVIALISTVGTAASSLLDSSALYVRPDGMPVGTGAEIVTAAVPVYGTDPADKYLHTGIWQTGDGSYPINDKEPLVWVGDSVMTRAGVNYCNDWTSTAGSARVGNYHDSAPYFWNTEIGGLSSPVRNCTQALRLYCIEK